MTQTTQSPEKSSGTQLLEQVSIHTDQLDGINSRLDRLIEAIAPMNGTSKLNGVGAPAGNGPNESLIEFDAEEIVTTLDDSGQRKLFRIKGGSFRTYGLRVWPEVLETLGFEPELMDLGSTPFHLRVAARVGIQGKQKVIGVAGGAH